MVALGQPGGCTGKNNCIQMRPAPKGLYGGMTCICPCHNGGECLGVMFTGGWTKRLHAISKEID